MCDIYTAKCPACGEETDMHLADYDTGRDEVEVYCEAHFPEDRSDGTTWVYGDRKERMVFVRALTDNARSNMSGNHPNCADAEEWGVPEGCMSVRDDAILSL